MSFYWKIMSEWMRHGKTNGSHIRYMIGGYERRLRTNIEMNSLLFSFVGERSRWLLVDFETYQRYANELRIGLGFGRLIKSSRPL